MGYKSIMRKDQSVSEGIMYKLQFPYVKVSLVNVSVLQGVLGGGTSNGIQEHFADRSVRV